MYVVTANVREMGVYSLEIFFQTFNVLCLYVLVTLSVGFVLATDRTLKMSYLLLEITDSLALVDVVEDYLSVSGFSGFTFLINSFSLRISSSAIVSMPLNI